MCVACNRPLLEELVAGDNSDDDIDVNDDAVRDMSQRVAQRNTAARNSDGSDAENDDASTGSENTDDGDESTEEHGEDAHAATADVAVADASASDDGYHEVPLAVVRKELKHLTKAARKSTRQRLRTAAEFGNVRAGDDDLGVAERRARAAARVAPAPAPAEDPGAAPSEDSGDDAMDESDDRAAAAFYAAVERNQKAKKDAKHAKYNPSGVSAEADDGRYGGQTEENRGITCVECCGDAESWIGYMPRLLSC